jgi:hypothetical protein
MGPDDLTPEETAKYEALAAEGDQAKLMKFINGLSCKYDMKPANFGDGVHHTCDATGGKKHRKSRKAGKSRKGGNSWRRNARLQMGGNSWDPNARLQMGGKTRKHKKSHKSRKHKKSHKSRKHKKSHKKRRH